MQKRNTTPKLYYAVRFPPCGAEFHPAFSDAIKFSLGNGQHAFQINFPLHLGYLRSKSSQRSWAEGKAKHIRSWGVQPEIVELAQPEKVIIR